MYEEMVDLLLKRGAEVDAKNKLGALTVFMWAVERNRLDVVRSLLDKGFDVKADPMVLLGAVDSGNLEVVRLILDEGADVNVIVGAMGLTALNGAAFKGHVEVANLLLEKGADVNGRDGGGFTALMDAAGRGHLEMVGLLLDKGADVNVKSSGMAWTALKIARRYGHKKIEETLIAHAAKE